MTPIPADETLAREIARIFNFTYEVDDRYTEAAQLIAAHVAAQAPSVLVVDDLIAHKAQPVADVRGMVEALLGVIERLKKYLDNNQVEWLEKEVTAALAAPRHAMGGEGS